MKPQVLVTSFDRLDYLKKTVATLRQDDIHLLIVDGGTEEGEARRETREFVAANADAAIFLDGNPGADVLKTIGIKKLVTAPEFIITSDDIGFPKGYSSLIFDQYRRINKGGLKWTYVACPKARTLELHAANYRVVNGVRVLGTSNSQVCGAIIDSQAARDAGYFPVYGKGGSGDWAFSKRMRDAGYTVGYWYEPVVEHYGDKKSLDYPEYTRRMDADMKRWGKQTKTDPLGHAVDVK